MRRGYLYLVVVMDWASRCALAWQLSNTLDSGFCVEALEAALGGYGKPESLQHGPRHAVHQRGLYRAVAGGGRAGVDGRGGDAGWTTCSSSGCGAR